MKIKTVHVFAPGEELSSKLLRETGLAAVVPKLSEKKGTIERLRKFGGTVSVLDDGSVLVEPAHRRKRTFCC